MADDLPIDSSRSVPAAALSWTAVRASGPGGQHVNRTESKVVLRFDPRAVPWLHERATARLAALAGTRLDREGRVILVSQATRDQGRNLEDARQRLAAMIRSALVVPKRRVATKPTRGSVRRRLDGKRKLSLKKDQRRKVRSDE